MPELAEVEYYRKRWDVGLGATIRAVELHRQARVLRAVDPVALQKALRGSSLIASEARGKQMLFRFSGGLWLGLHLGMTGKLRVEPSNFSPARHDHLVLYQRGRALVFSDMRQFGRVFFHISARAPEWWANLPPALNSNHFTVAVMTDFLQRHRRLPIKAALLLQDGFPGIGNWMADEILWRTKLHPRVPAGTLRPLALRQLWRTIRFICAAAMEKIGKDFSDPPCGWFFHERWSREGRCPREKASLARETVGGRTTAWCPKCQARPR